MPRMNHDQATAWLDLIKELSLKTNGIDLPALIDRGSVCISHILNQINTALSLSPKALINVRNLLTVYCSTYYSLEKSKDLVLISVEKQAANYSNVPLIYTSQCLPSAASYPSDTWRLLEAVSSFDKKDYGRINLIDSLLSLQQEGKLQILSFAIRCLTLYGALVVEVTVSPSNKTSTQPKSITLKGGYQYVTLTKKITKGEKYFKALSGTKSELIVEFFFTKTNADEDVSWDELAEFVLDRENSRSKSQSRKSFLDAVHRVNNGFRKAFNTTEALITWENKRIRRNI